MFTIYSLTPNHTHLFREVGPLAETCGVHINHIVNKFYICPKSKCSRATLNNFVDNTEKAMYYEDVNFPGQLFLENEPCITLLLITVDHRVCLGRYGRLNPEQEQEEVFAFKNHSLSLVELRELHQNLYDLISFHLL
jgi:hypothetical protein